MTDSKTKRDKHKNLLLGIIEDAAEKKNGLLEFIENLGVNIDSYKKKKEDWLNTFLAKQKTNKSK